DGPQSRPESPVASWRSGFSSRIGTEGMARAAVSRLRLVVPGGWLTSELGPPLRGLLGLASLVIKPHDPLAGLGKIVLERCGDLGRVPLHPLVASDQESLGLIELLRVVLAPQALAEQALAAEPEPVVGLPVARHVVAQQRLGLGVLLLLETL